MRKGLNYFVSFLLLFCIGILSVSALETNEIYMLEKLASTSAPKINSVSVSGSVATIRSTGSVSGYYVGTKNSLNDSTTYYASSSSDIYYVGVKNGTYYFWVYGGSSVTGSAGAIQYAGAVNVTSSCSNQVVSGVTGTVQYERCMVSENGGYIHEDVHSVPSCAAGYERATDGLQLVNNGCKTLQTKQSGQQLARAYCKMQYSFTCVKSGSSSQPPSSGENPGTPGVSVAAASLSNLTVSQGALSPGFSSGQKSYTVSVGSDVSSITIGATAGEGSSFVSGAGPRTVNLNYGANKIQVKVKNSAGSVTTYTVVVTRADGRSGVNTLSAITVSAGSLSPAFSSANTSYVLDVGANVESVNIGANVSDGASSFVEGFGPRTVTLRPGVNSVLLKVQSENGHTKVYTITVVRASESASCGTDIEKLALLKAIDLKSDIEGVSIKQLEFDSNTFTYNITVPYAVGNLTVEAFVEEEGDTYTVVGADNLEVNIEQDVQITVTSRTCSSVTKVYHIGVTREEEKELSSNAELKDLTITNHNEFVFEQNTIEYRLKLHKNENVLDIKYEAEEENTTCNIDGNSNLGYGSNIEITCVSEDGENTVNYLITIDGVEKGTNIFLMVLIILVVILLIGYLILRILGYKVYFNFAIIGAFFRGIGEKIKNVFDK